MKAVNKKTVDKRKEIFPFPVKILNNFSSLSTAGIHLFSSARSIFIISHQKFIAHGKDNLKT